MKGVFYFLGFFILFFCGANATVSENTVQLQTLKEICLRKSDYVWVSTDNRCVPIDACNADQSLYGRYCNTDYSYMQIEYEDANMLGSHYMFGVLEAPQSIRGVKINDTDIAFEDSRAGYLVFRFDKFIDDEAQSIKDRLKDRAYAKICAIYDGEFIHGREARKRTADKYSDVICLRKNTGATGFEHACSDMNNGRLETVELKEGIIGATYVPYDVCIVRDLSGEDL